MDLDQTVVDAHRHQPQPEAATQAQIVVQRLAESLARAQRNGNVDRVGQLLSVDRLVEKRQRETGLEFDDDGIVAIAQSDDVGRADLTLYLVALTFEQPLDGRVKVGLSQSGRRHAHPYRGQRRCGNPHGVCRRRGRQSSRTSTRVALAS